MVNTDDLIKLTPGFQHLFSRFRNVEPVCVLPTVPDEDLRVGRDRFYCVEVYVEVNLTGNEILLGRTVAEVHVVHPVTLTCVTHVETLVYVIVLENLGEEKRPS